MTVGSPNLEAGGEWEDDRTGDLGRVTRQQIFMREAAERVVGRIRSNPVAATGMVDIALDAVTID
jgi:polyisoprenyl-teichoic acid--peptidoglycan teichoic acid transferase